MVEDEAELLQPMTLALKQAGYVVRSVRDGRSALNILLADQSQGLSLPDLLITDLEMPGLTGLALLDELEKRQMHIPAVLAMSGDGDRDSLVALMRHGASDFLDKPFGVKVFLERVRQLVQRIENTRQQEAERVAGLAAENQALRQRMRQFEARESMARLTRGILHDVNNCLAIITGSAEMIKLSLAGGEKPVDGYADSITSLTQKAVDTLHQLHALNRLGEGVWTCFDLHTLITGTLELIRTVLGGRLRIHTDFLSQPAWVQGDAVTMQNAIISVLLAMRDGLGDAGGVLHLSTRLEETAGEEGRRDGWIVLRLSSSGSALNAARIQSPQEILRSQGGDLRFESQGEFGYAIFAEMPAAALPIRSPETVEVQAAA